MPNPLPIQIVEDLRSIVGRDGVITDPSRLMVYESDALTAYRTLPQAVVFPQDTQQVSSVLERLSSEGIPIVPRGAGTGLSGGAVAHGDAVVVCTARMTRILEFDEANRRALLQPGVINADLSEATRPLGLHYAPDPSSQTACTIGGNVAENSGGPHCLKYGVTTRYITGLTVVLGSGEVLRLGGQGREAGGLDFVGLFVGSEGCFGIATEIEVRLTPLPQGVRTVLALFDDLTKAAEAVSAVMADGLLPAALEIIDGATIRAVEASRYAAGYPTDVEAALVIEFDGMETALDAQVERAVELCSMAGARELTRARTEEERAALWQGRKKAFGAMGRIAPDLMVQDATVPRTQLPGVLRRIQEIAAAYSLNVANVFHAGDGNLHPNILFDRRDQEELARVEAASHEIMQACVDAGGTITGEHGVGLDKLKYMELIHSREDLTAQAAVKAVWDPTGLMNPGKVLP